MIAEIAAAVSERIGTTPHGVRRRPGPTPAEVLSDLADDRPAVVVPAFRSSGYHVRQDLPGHIEGVGRPGTIVTRALGPDPVIAAVLRLRLIEGRLGAGRRGGAGRGRPSDASARGQVHLAARQLESLIGGRVEVGFIATAEPTVPQAITRARRRLRRGGKLVVASYLLAPGLFTPGFSGWTSTPSPNPGADPRICDLIVTCMRAAVSPYRRPAAVTWR